MNPKCRKCDSLIPAPTAAPAWANPRLIMQQTAFKFSVFQAPAMGNHQVAVPDPKRVGIGFSTGQTGGTYFAPQPDPDDGGWSSFGAAGAVVLWFTTFEHGPMVNVGWWVYVQGACDVYVYEVYRLS